MAKPIFFFEKDAPYSELSNFSPHGFVEDGIAWATVEHYFQAMKFQNVDHRERIRMAKGPMEAKTLGQSRNVSIRSDWEEMKEAVMLHGLRKKFENLELQKLLLSTKSRELIENSPYDSYWGIGPRGKGKNRLGVLLMQVRKELQSSLNNPSKKKRT